MKVHTIKAYCFRNYHEMQVEFAPTLNLFVGENGVGKTNILDLIHYLGTGKSYFTGLDREVVKRGSDVMRLEGKFKLEDEEGLVIKWSKKGGKSLQWNEVDVDKMSDHIGKVRVVMMAPQDAFVLQLGNTERRKWLDRLLCQKNAEYAKALRTYHKVLQRRNIYLKDTLPQALDDQLLKVYWDQMGHPAKVIFEYRRTAVSALSEVLKNRYGDLSGSREEVDMQYISHLEGVTWSSLHNLRSDILQKSTQQGIHKDKIEFRIKGERLKHMASEGQRKSYFLALKMGELDFLSTDRAQPILLIDDVFSKLDQDRVTRLFKILSKLEEVQVMVTDTHENRIRDLWEETGMYGRLFVVKDGDVRLKDEKEK